MTKEKKQNKSLKKIKLKLFLCPIFFFSSISLLVVSAYNTNYDKQRDVQQKEVLSLKKIVQNYPTKDILDSLKKKMKCAWLAFSQNIPLWPLHFFLLWCRWE